MCVKNIFIAISSLFLASPLFSQLPDQHRWSDRVILLFAPSPEHAAFQRQNSLLDEARPGVSDRDLVVYRLFEDRGVDPRGQPLPPASVRSLRRAYQPSENGFTFILVGKDGTEKLREKSVVSTEELFGLIDRMPMRREEMRRKGRTEEP